jgi:hypothetical protein
MRSQQADSATDGCRSVAGQARVLQQCDPKVGRARVAAPATPRALIVRSQSPERRGASRITCTPILRQEPHDDAGQTANTKGNDEHHNRGHFFPRDQMSMPRSASSRARRKPHRRGRGGKFYARTGLAGVIRSSAVSVARLGRTGGDRRCASAGWDGAGRGVRPGGRAQ